MVTLPLARRQDSWVPDSCVLPTQEQPLRVLEFDELFTAHVRSGELIGPAHLRLSLTPEPEVASRVAGLAAREARCCEFFTFTMTVTASELTLDVTVPKTHAAVLAALAARVAPEETLRGVG